MAREVRLLVWCDPCLAQEEQSEAEEFTLSLGGAAAKALALCERHRKELLDPIADALAEHGYDTAETPGKSTAKASGSRTGKTFPCPVPDCPRASEPYAYKTSLNSHLDRMHPGLKAPAPAPATGERPAGGTATEGTETCPECGQEFTGAYRAQSLGAHRSRKHGVKGQSRSSRYANAAAEGA